MSRNKKDATPDRVWFALGLAMAVWAAIFVVLSAFFF